jgi:hypothetical protein
MTCPSSSPRTSCTFSTRSRGWVRLISITAWRSCGWAPMSCDVWASDITSLGKHEPPYPAPASRKAGPMRWSMPMPWATTLMSASTFSHTRATSLMKEILVARKALLAYLIISAVYRLVISTGASSGLYSSATRAAAARSWVPSTMRSGSMKSCTAEPSRRNSGLETTGTESRDGDRVVRMMSDTTSPVPIGTVLLLTITTGSVRCSAIIAVARRTSVRSASPVAPMGVPTARKMNSASGTASAYNVVNRSRREARFRDTISCRPGSKKGTSPRCRASITSSRTSTPRTSLPRSAKQAAVVSPT